MYEREPTPAAIQEIRAHLESEHDWTDFDLLRDVAFGENAPATAMIAYIAQSRTSSARFRCSGCPAQIFLAGEPAYGDPMRNSLLQWAHPEQEMLLHGAGGLENRALLGEELDRGELAKSLVSAAPEATGHGHKEGRQTHRRRSSRALPDLPNRARARGHVGAQGN